jgi:hypothetical protein
MAAQHAAKEAAFPRLLQKGIMDRKNIIELALEALHTRQTAVGAEIAFLKGELARLSGEVRSQAAAAVTPAKRRTKTAEERRRHSEKMKQIWAARKARAAKPKPAAAAAPLPAGAAANKARSEKMKAYWAKKRKPTK